MNIIYILIAVYLAICVILGVVKYVRDNKPVRVEWETEEESESSETTQERTMLLDETIVKYQRLLDNLTAQYNGSYSETEKAKILSKQITTMEKLNRALEKREKLG